MARGETTPRAAANDARPRRALVAPHGVARLRARGTPDASRVERGAREASSRGPSRETGTPASRRAVSMASLPRVGLPDDDPEANTPLHMVRHSVTRHPIRRGDDDLDADDVAENAVTVMELARAVKAERARQLRDFDRELRRRVAEHEAARSVETDAEQLADEMADISLVAGSRGARSSAPPEPSPLEILMRAKAQGVRESHRALLASAVPSVFRGGARTPAASDENAARCPPAPFVGKNALDEARAESERQRVKNARDAAAKAERRRAARRTQERLGGAVDVEREREGAEEGAVEGAEDGDAEDGDAEETCDPSSAPSEEARANAASAREARAREDRAARFERVTRRARLTEDLRALVTRQLARKHVVLPPLCGCPHAATTPPFDPEAVYRCAHNCPLHGDEAAYQGALSQMLAAHDILIAPPARG